jgi:hypothetical protein
LRTTVAGTIRRVGLPATSSAILAGAFLGSATGATLATSLAALATRGLLTIARAIPTFRPRRTQFIRRELPIAIFIQRFQRLGRSVDFRRRDGAIVIFVEGSDERRRRAALALGPTLRTALWALLRTPLRRAIGGRLMGPFASGPLRESCTDGERECKREEVFVSNHVFVCLGFSYRPARKPAGSAMQ